MAYVETKANQRPISRIWVMPLAGQRPGVFSRKLGHNAATPGAHGQGVQQRCPHIIFILVFQLVCPGYAHQPT